MVEMLSAFLVSRCSKSVTRLVYNPGLLALKGAG
jgi:hypothetical protein